MKNLYIVLILFGMLLSCQKPDERNDYRCTQFIKASAPGYLEQYDTLIPPIQLSKTNDEIIQYMKDFTFTQTKLDNGIYITTDYKMVCHALRIEVCPKY